MDDAAHATLGPFVRLRAEMSRRPLVIALVVLVAALLLAPIVLMMLAGQATDGLPDDGTAPEVIDPEPLAAEDVDWAIAFPLLAGPANTYTLQAGTLSEHAPLVDLEVPFGLDPNTNPGRMPAMGMNDDGRVVFVADDGNRSSLRRIAIARAAIAEELAVVDHVVYSLVVAPGGQHAYLAIGERQDAEHDLGIVRVSLDGQAVTEPVFDPALGAREEPAVMLAAVVGFHVDIALSVDGRHLIRHACAGPAGCASQVIDTQTHAVTPLGDRTVRGVAGGIALTQHCAANCVFELIDLSSGEKRPLPGVELDAAITLVDGRPRIAVVDTEQGGAAVLRSVDPVDGSISDVFRTRPGASLSLMPLGTDVVIALPEGYVLADMSGEDVGAIVAMHMLAIPLDGAPPVELGRPPIRHEFGDVQG
jgi:hypothetical protein